MVRFMKHKTYNIITLGCQMNKSDSERIAGYLENLGYKLNNDRYSSDLVVVNTCGVRQSAEDRIYGIIPRIKKKNPKAKIVLTGCLSNREDVKKRLKEKVDIWLPTVQIPNLKYQITNKFQIPNNKSQSCGYLKIKSKYSSMISAFVPIGNGCNNFCSYCVVPMARGGEVYRPAKDIVQEVENLVKIGYKEINLIAQNVNSYKSQITNNKFQTNSKLQITNSKQINFSGLLQMINSISGNFWIRFSTSHPKDMSDELIKIITNCKKVCRHIHLPAQSGDNEILKKMNRNYTAGHYKKLIKKIRRAMPDTSITTDAIVGFPGETREQFNNTAELFKEMKFDMAYVSKYSPRPGTAAENLDDNVSREEKKKREENLMRILRKTAWENNKQYIGEIVEVLIEGEKNNFYFGKIKTGKSVRIMNYELGIRNLVGKFVKVKIIKSRDFGLEGEIA